MPLCMFYATVTCVSHTIRPSSINTSTYLSTPFGDGSIQTGQQTLTLAALIQVTLLCSTEALSLGSVRTASLSRLKPNVLRLVSADRRCHGYMREMREIMIPR